MLPRRFVRTLLESALAWTIIGVPVATVIAATRVVVWVIMALPDMVCTAAVLGLAHGVWLYLGGSPSVIAQRRRFGALSGALLGSLGFAPVFSRINEIVVDRLTVAVFFGAATIAGLAAGLVAEQAVGRFAGPGRRRRRVVGVVLLLTLASVDYVVFWPAVVDRLPVPRVSAEAIAQRRPGSARGSEWSGCYAYLGVYSRGSGGAGTEGGTFTVAQADGTLAVQIDGAQFTGAVDASGSFRFGGERISGADTLRELWEGRFGGNSSDFTRRLTIWEGQTAGNRTRITGTVRRQPCH